MKSFALLYLSLVYEVQKYIIAFIVFGKLQIYTLQKVVRSIESVEFYIPVHALLSVQVSLNLC